jgi:hypothetical protein
LTDREVLILRHFWYCWVVNCRTMVFDFDHLADNFLDVITGLWIWLHQCF